MQTKEDAEKQERYWIQYYLKINPFLKNTVNAYGAIHQYDTNKVKKVYTRKASQVNTLTDKEVTMEMEQVKGLFRSTGWTMHMRKRRKGTQYVYAARRIGEEVREVYFAPWLKVEQMSQEQVLEKLATLKK